MPEVSAACLFFRKPVLLQATTFGPADFYACYFLGGLRVSDCEFQSTADFQCGGHNQGDNIIAFEQTQFRGFVNFFDCWFTGPIMVRNCRFEAGTNLLGNEGTPMAVTFDVSPVLEGNFGDLRVADG